MKLRLGFVSNSSSASFTLFLSVGSKQTPEDAVRKYVEALAASAKRPLDGFVDQFAKSLAEAAGDDAGGPEGQAKSDSRPKKRTREGEVIDSKRARAIDALVGYLTPAPDSNQGLPEWIADLEQSLKRRDEERQREREERRQERRQEREQRRASDHSGLPSGSSEEDEDEDSSLSDDSCGYGGYGGMGLFGLGGHCSDDENQDDRKMLAFAQKLGDKKTSRWQVVQTGMSNECDCAPDDAEMAAVEEALYDEAGKLHRLRAGGSVAYVVHHDCC
eukprot:m51a1_g10458 hypothetical protein (274) ;mRNA; f:30386-31537